MRKAEDFFLCESEHNTDRYIEKMRTELSNCGYWLIPHDGSYVCDIELKEFKSITLLHT